PGEAAAGTQAGQGRQVIGHRLRTRAQGTVAMRPMRRRHDGTMSAPHFTGVPRRSGGMPTSSWAWAPGSPCPRGLGHATRRPVASIAHRGGILLLLLVPSGLCAASSRAGGLSDDRGRLPAEVFAPAAKPKAPLTDLAVYPPEIQLTTARDR